MKQENDPMVCIMQAQRRIEQAKYYALIQPRLSGEYLREAEKALKRAKEIIEKCNECRSRVGSKMIP